MPPVLNCLLALLVLCSCQSWELGGGEPFHRRPAQAKRDPGPMAQHLIDLRNQAIAAEEPGDYFIGRRFHLPKTHFWGYVRRPRQSWDEAKLVIMSEANMQLPDRLPELPSVEGAPAHGHDHNVEYKIRGRFSARRIYDPNSNMVLPEFVPSSMEVRLKNAGWIFAPDDILDGSYLPRYEYGVIPGEP